MVSRPNDRFEIAAITVAELWPGIARATGTHKVARQPYRRAVLESLAIIPYTEQTAYEHARIGGELEASCKMIGFNDLIVRPTAIERGSPVVEPSEPAFRSRSGDLRSPLAPFASAGDFLRLRNDTQ